MKTAHGAVHGGRHFRTWLPGGGGERRRTGGCRVAGAARHRRRYQTLAACGGRCQRRFERVHRGGRRARPRRPRRSRPRDSRRIGRGAVCGQGQHRGTRLLALLRLGAAAPVDGALYRHRRRPPAGCGGPRGGQDQPGRVRDGFLQRELLLRGGAQPLESAGGGRRLQRRLRRGGGGRHGALCPGLGHRRLGTPAGLVLRRLRSQAHLRRRVALRSGGIRLVPGRDRHHRRGGRHREHGVRDHPRRGPARPVIGGLPGAATAGAARVPGDRYARGRSGGSGPGGCAPAWSRPESGWRVSGSAACR